MIVGIRIYRRPHIFEIGFTIRCQIVKKIRYVKIVLLDVIVKILYAIQNLIFLHNLNGKEKVNVEHIFREKAVDKIPITIEIAVLPDFATLAVHVFPKLEIPTVTFYYGNLFAEQFKEPSSENGRIKMDIFLKKSI